MTEWNNMSISEKIKHARESMGYSQSQLAKISGLAQSSISYIESGNKKPNIETVSILAKALDLPVSYLLDNQTIGDTLPPKLAELIRFASGLSDDRQELLLKIAKGLSNDSIRL